ncbi:MAG: polysaccharide deacetylase family protein [Candidatus Vogelbacteria bacterium]|nr:polysaccharide deacetylase family protein [Candidatus Vogelbacteria bacterium]
MLKVTTSWDDGDILDNRLSDMLIRYGIKGTFYITKELRLNRLTDDDIKRLATTQEIGAHTLTHPDLRELSPEKQREEIAGSKKWLENLLDFEVKMFCYPKGFYDDSVVTAVKEAGFIGARTTGLGFINSPIYPFRMNTTIQVYPFPFRKLGAKRYYLRKLFEPYAQRAFNLKHLGVPTRSMYSWLSATKATFDSAIKTGEVFHLWGHSWEIEKYGMWNDLEKFLQYACERKSCVYLTNGELL